MKNDKIGAISKSLQRRLPQVRALRGALLALGAGLCGALLTGPVLWEDRRPLGLAFLIACPEPYGAFAMVGCLAAYWLGGVSPDYAAYLAACGVVTAVRWLLAGGKATRAGKLFWPSFAAASVSLSLTRLSVAALLSRLDLQAVFSLLAELAVLFLIALGFRSLHTAAAQLRSGISPSLAVKFGCALAALCLSAALCSYNTGLLSVGHMLTAFGVLAAVHCFSTPDGSALAAMLCTGCMLAEPQFAFGAAAMLLGGCTAPFFAARGKGGFVLGFLVPAAVCCLAAPSELFAAVYLTELFCGAFLFLLLPLPRIAASAAPPQGYLQAAGAVSGRLLAASQSLSDIAALLSRALPVPKEPAAGELFACCVEKVCRGCRGMGDCWLRRYDRTYGIFSRLAKQLMDSGSLTKEQVQRAFGGECFAAGALSAEMQQSYAAGVAAAREQRSAVICREMLKGQFSAAAEMLLRVREEMEALGGWDEEMGRRIHNHGANLALPLQGVCCTKTGQGAPLVTLFWKSEPTERDCAQMASGASLLLGCRMQPSPAKKVQLGWQSTLLPQPLFTLDTAVVQHAAGRSVCGDVYSIFPDSRTGCTHLLLCDGMGTGSAAAQDGALSCSLLCRLLQNGFEVSSACSLVNAAFSLRQDTESACTVDLCRFDGLTGQAQLLKAGAAASWVLQGGRLRRIEGRTLPVGILDQVFCARTEVALQPGDLLVLASDGLDEFRAEAEKLLLASDDLSPQALCDALLAAAKAGGLSDDLTILAARVSRAA